MRTYKRTFMCAACAAEKTDEVEAVDHYAAAMGSWAKIDLHACESDGHGVWRITAVRPAVDQAEAQKGVIAGLQEDLLRAEGNNDVLMSRIDNLQKVIFAAENQKVEARNETAKARGFIKALASALRHVNTRLSDDSDYWNRDKLCCEAEAFFAGVIDAEVTPKDERILALERELNLCILQLAKIRSAEYEARARSACKVLESK